jgi:hypothetical protein
MISKFIRAQGESKEMENVDDERQQLLEEASFRKASLWVNSK